MDYYEAPLVSFLHPPHRRVVKPADSEGSAKTAILAVLADPVKTAIFLNLDTVYLVSNDTFGYFFIKIWYACYAKSYLVNSLQENFKYKFRRQFKSALNADDNFNLSDSLLEMCHIS